LYSFEKGKNRTALFFGKTFCEINTMKPPVHVAEFRFHEELNDHLPPNRRKRSFTVEIEGEPAVGELIAVLCVPTTEVDLLLVKGESSKF
jgi:uncharacterized protein